MRQAEEVAEQGGMRWFIVAIVIAGLLGTLARLMVAPHKVEMIVRAKVETSPWSRKFEFKSAEVDLADGPLPDFALVLKNASWRPTGDCRSEGEHRELAPVRASTIRIPLKWSSLFQGRLSAGRIEFEDLKIDVDEAKRTCADGRPSVAASESNQVAPNKSTTETPVATPPLAPSPVAAPASAVTTIFTAEELSEIAKRIGGVRFLSAEVFFENRMKSVLLEDAVITVREKEVDVSTLVRFPPATVFGETAPAFTVVGTVRPNEILADVRADLNEGTLEGNVVLRPILSSSGQKELDSQVKLSVSDLPLSMMTPLLTKSKVVRTGFRPRFAWLDCNAEVKGIFSRLFVENPLLLSQCEISGQAGRVRVDKAQRDPSGQWKPFELILEDVDIGRVIETFQVEGASGVFADYGKLTSKVLVNSPDDFRASGSVKGAVVRFAGGEGMALQTLDVNSIAMASMGRHLKFQMSDVAPIGGAAVLTVDADHDLEVDETKFSFNLESLKLNPRVEKVVFTGPVGKISGQANGLIKKKVLTKLKLSLALQEIAGTEFSSADLRLEAQVAAQQKNPVIEVTAKSALIEVQKSGHLYALLRPALLGWIGVQSQDGKRLTVGKVSIRGRFSDAGFHWTTAQAGVGGVLNLSSEGQVFRDQIIEAKLEAGYPAVRRLAWDVRGTWRKPEFAIASEELRTLLKRPDVVIPLKAGDQGVAIELAEVPLRHLGITN